MRKPCRWCGETFEGYHQCDYSESRKELYCEHGIGHGHHVHGCDGCCSKKEWKEAWKKYVGDEK